MNRFVIPILFSLGLILNSCSQEPRQQAAELKTGEDSLAYVIGVSIADNLIAMDSTINIAAVCRAISERASSKSIIDSEDAKSYYLRYITYVEPERKRGYEEQYLEDLTKANRDFTRSKSGLTYNIEVIGDEKFTPKRINDLVSICYTIARVNGEEVFSSYKEKDTLSLALKDMQEGLQESVKMVGKGGKVKAWLPSKLAYGEAGDEKLGVKPFETLYYEIELIDMEVNGAR